MTSILLEARIAEAIIDPDGYREQLLSIIANLGELQGSTESEMVDILANARLEVAEQLGAMAIDAPSRAVYERTLAGIDGTLEKMKSELGTTLTKAQADAFKIGENLAITPAVSRGVELVGSGVTLDQLAILASYSPDLIGGITADLRKKINVELTSIMVGAKSPHSAAVAIGKNLTDRNHFSTIAHRARAIVVTEVGRAQALGTQAAQNQLQQAINEQGESVVVKKRWLNAHLPGARATHLEAEARYHPDGEKGPIPVDQLYEVGGFKALYPKDPSLPASESVNCHCVSITVVSEAAKLPIPPAAAPAPAPAPQPAPKPPKPKPPITTPEEVAAVQGAYSAAKAKAAAGAVKKTTKAKSTKAATFLSDPYSAAGLEPLKPMPDGSNGYGGQFMGKILGWGKPEDGPFTFKGSVWYHNAAPAGKQLPDFKKLSVDEQLALMTNAKLTKSQMRSVWKSVGAPASKYELKLVGTNAQKFLDNPWQPYTFKTGPLAGQIRSKDLGEIFGLENIEDIPGGKGMRVKGAPPGSQVPTLKTLHDDWPGGDALVLALMEKAKVAQGDRKIILNLLLDDLDDTSPLTKPYAVKKPPVMPTPAPSTPSASRQRIDASRAPANDPEIIAGLKTGTPPPDDWDRERSIIAQQQIRELDEEYRARPLTGSERTAVTGYTNGEYGTINRALRMAQGDLSQVAASTRQKVEAIKAAIKRFGVRDDWVVSWRASTTGNRDAFVQAALEAASKGEHLTLHGFTSSSVKTRVFGGIPSSANGNLVFEIFSKRGVWAQPITRHSSEYEFILDEGTSYEILGWRSITHNGQQYQVLQLREVI